MDDHTLPLNSLHDRSPLSVGKHEVISWLAGPKLKGLLHSELLVLLFKSHNFLYLKEVFIDFSIFFISVF